MKNSLIIPLFIVIIALCSCNNNNKVVKSGETIDSGSVSIYYDESYSFVLDSVFKLYKERYPKVTLELSAVNARNATSHLLSGQTRIAIIGRDMLKDEDSLMQAYNVKNYYKMEIANDALIFFTQVAFPLDTLNTDIISQVFTKNKLVNEILPKAPSNTEFAIANINSSEYGNFMNLVLQKQPLTMKAHNTLHLLPNVDSVIAFVEKNTNAIGIAYLSQIQGKFFKILRVGYNDSTGKYVQATKPPHQSYIIMGEYPYITTLRLYLLEDRKNLPFWCGTFIEKEAVCVNYYKKMRLVPSYATYSLEDERR